MKLSIRFRSIMKLVTPSGLRRIRLDLLVLTLCLGLVIPIMAMPAPRASAAIGDPISYIHDELGRLVAVVDPAGDTARYHYDLLGNVTSITRQPSSTVSIIEFLPDSADPGATVTISGTGFSSTPSENTVKFNGTNATVVSANATRIIAAVPAGAGSGPITVTAPGGSANSSSFSVTSTTPTINSVTPTVAKAGDVITITGSNFEAELANNKIGFGRVRPHASAATTTSLQFAVPSGVLTGAVSVSTPYGKATGGDVFVPPGTFMPSDVAATARLNIGEPKTLTVGTANKVALAVFEGNAAQRVYLKMNGSTFGSCPRVDVFTPDGATLRTDSCANSGDYFDTTTLPISGTYTILLDPAGTTTGTISFQMLDVPPDSSGAISIGGPAVTATTISPGQNPYLSFEAAANQHIYVKITNSTFQTCPPVGIYSPSGGTVLYDFCAKTGDYFDTTTLSAAGTYKLTVDPTAEQTGAITFQILDVPPDPSGSITIGGPAVTAANPSPGQNPSLSFNAAANQRIYVRMTNLTYPSCAWVRLLNPSGSNVAYDPCATTGDYFDTATLSTAGTYKLTVDPTAEQTGAITFQILNVPPDPSGSITIGGPAVTATNTSPGQNPLLTFTGNAGQQVKLTMSNRTHATCARVTVHNPAGSTLANDPCANQGDTLNATLATSGTHKIVLNPQGEEIGSLTFALTQSGSTAARTTDFRLAALEPSAEENSPQPTLQESPDVPATSNESPSPPPDAGDRARPDAPIDGPSPNVPNVEEDTTPEPTRVTEPAPQEPSIPPEEKTTERLEEERRKADAAKAKELEEGAKADQAKEQELAEKEAERTKEREETAKKEEESKGSLTGKVWNLIDEPLEGVAVSIGELKTTTDASGAFMLTKIPPGHHELTIDGRSPTKGQTSHGVFVVGVDIATQERKTLPYTVWLPDIDADQTIKLSSPTTREVVLSNPKVPGLEVHIPKGTVVTDRDGKVVKELSITPIPEHKPPFPLPPLVDTPVYFTIQPGGVNFSIPAQVIYPNLGMAPAGMEVDFWHYDTEQGWYIYGDGKVSKDGRQIVPAKNTGIYETTGAMVNAGRVPAAIGRLLDSILSYDGDPVDLGTGLFIYEKTDLVLADTLPLALTRTYRPADTVSRSFGIGANHAYDMFLWSANQYQEADLILPDSARVHYVRTSPGTGWLDAVFEAQTTPGTYYRSKIVWNGRGWDLTLKDGTVLVFGENAPLQSIRDRRGNQVVVTRTNGQSGNIAQVTSPHGRFIQFTYDASDRVTQAKDNIGRTVGYEYDGSGRLWKVTDPAGGITEYGYDTGNRMTTIEDARDIVFLTNQYTGDRVTKQTQADGTTYSFDYTVGANGRATETRVTDPRGMVRKVNFDSAGFTISDTSALGKPEEQGSSFERYPGSNLLKAVVDSLGRRTEFAYDAQGDLTEQVRNLGTSEAITARFTYEPVFHQVASSTDPLNKTTNFSYDPKGNLKVATDPLGHQTKFEYDGEGLLTKTTDAENNETTLAYDFGDLSSVTDPLRRKSTSFLDSAGRPISAIAPDGSRTRTLFDNLNLPSKVTNAIGGITRFGYDPNGNLLSFKDAKNNETIYTYDNMDRVKTRKDPLLKQDVYEYEPGGALKKATDRRGLVSVFKYDILGRSTFTGFDENGEDYESTITSSYDQADRLTSAIDSLSGTITLDYDSLDRLKSETTPRGSVAYTYDAVGNRKTMTVGGQAQVAYGYDNAHRLTSITQGSQAVGFGYDNAGRQTSQSMPGGITSTYAYDAASQLSSITHKAGATTLGDLIYGYDLGGRRSSVKGSMARTGLPAALSSATYDVNNRLKTWGATSLSYDNSGNLTADGTNSYTWNARGQLASISGGATASFGYDAFGRRSSATAAGVATGFHYDGSEVVQELTGTTPKSNLLTGGTDQRFTRSDSAGTKTYLTDALGSTVALADQSGALETQYSYTPFGKAAASGPTSTNSFQFTGRENDGTGLQYNRARYYHPTLGRFISEDPLGYAAGDPNLYGYVGNSPVNLTDPSGMMVPVGACLGGAAFGAAVHVIDMNLSGRKATVGSVLAAGGIGCAESLLGLGVGRALGKLTPRLTKTTDLLPRDAQWASRQLVGQNLPGSVGYGITPGGRTLSAHAAERIALGGGGRPAGVPLKYVDEILDTGSAVRYDPMRQSIQVRAPHLPGRPYVVVDSKTGRHIVTVMVPKL